MHSGLAVTFTVVYLSLCRVLPGLLNCLFPWCVWANSEEYLTLDLWVTAGFNGYGRGWFMTSQPRIKWKEGWPTRSWLLRIRSSHNRASFASDVTTCVFMVAPSIIVWRFCCTVVWRDVWKFCTNSPSPPPPGMYHVSHLFQQPCLHRTNDVKNFFYRCLVHSSRHGMCCRMQVLYAINVSCSKKA